MDWIELALALGLFVVSHRVPAWIGVKAGLEARLGPRGYTAAFSALSLVALAWVIAAAGRAPHVPLWDQAVWQRWAVNLAMPAALVLAALGVGAANPFAFEGRPTGYDPARPGIAGLTRQPLLWALALWSGAHLLANGALAHALVFAPFLLLSLAGMGVVERRRRAAMGTEAWARLARSTGLVPGAALLAGRWRPALAPPWGRLALGLLVWAALWHLHLPVIGAWPGP
jgi:uncharacterized membrane protein